MTDNDIFRIADAASFEAAALETFHRQAATCPPYCEYLRLIGVRPDEVRRACDIPALPIELFKSHEIYSDALAGPLRGGLPRLVPHLLR